MGRLGELRRRVGQVFRRERLARELEAEMRCHIEMAAAEQRDNGLPPDVAHFTAQRQFGNLTGLKERSVEAWGWIAVEQIFRDFCHALRRLAKRPALVAITVASLGLGIGSMMAVVIVINALLLRPPGGLDRPDRLVAFYTSRDDGSSYGLSSFPDYLDLIAGVSALDGVAASEYDIIKMDENGSRLFTERVTGNFFEVMGARPVVGRAFLPAETQAGSAEAVVVISHSLWRRQFGGNLNIVGSTIRLSGRYYTIIGVAPEGLASRFLSLQPDIWVSLVLATDGASARSKRLEQRSSRALRVMGRLREGATLDEVRAQAAVVERRLQTDWAADWKDMDGRPRRLTAMSERASRIDPANRTQVATMAGFFLIVAALILLVACTNVMSLFMAELGRRRREIAVRLALGAARSRLVRLLVSEGLVIGLAGGLLGVLLGAGGLQAFVALPMPFGIPLLVDLSVDWRVLGATFLLAVGASLVFSLAPSLQASRLVVVPALKYEASGAAIVGRRINRHSVLVVVQFAAAVVLLTGAALFIRGLQAATSADLGIDPDRIATMTKQVPAGKDSPEAGRAYLVALRERLALNPGVADVAFSSGLELAGMNTGVRLSVEGADPKTARFGARNSVSPGYLEMLGVKMVRGRTIQESDVAGSPLVAVINIPMARLLWQDAEPVGKRFVLQRIGGYNEGERRDASVFEVVGVAREAAYLEIGAPGVPYCWTSLYQDLPPMIAVSLKGRRSAGEMVQVLRQTVAVEADEVTPLDPVPLATAVDNELGPMRVASRVLGWGGIFALVLAGIGIYGIVSFAVARRRREIAIRLAVGAPRQYLLRCLVRDGLMLAIAGLAAGVLVAIPLAWLVRYQLYGLSPIDPVSFATTVLLLVGTAFVGTLVPARRVLRIDPVEVLKEE
jgi:predicted permease